MKKHSLLLLLSASMLLASCGGGNNPQPASSSADASSSVPASEPASEPEKSDSSSSSDPYVKPTEDNMGVLADMFYSHNGCTLILHADEAQLVASEDVLDLVPVGIGEEIYTQKAHGITQKEKLPTLLLTAGEDEYRAHLSVGDMKSLILEKKNGDKYDKVDTFMPSASEFSGTFTLSERGSLDPNDMIYAFSGIYDAENNGFPVKAGQRSGMAYSSIPWYTRSFFARENDGFVKAIDVYDTTDDTYFDTPVKATDTGLHIIGESAESEDYFIPTFSLLLGEVVLDDGTKYTFDYDEDGLMEWDNYTYFGLASLHHDETGYFFTFEEEGETKVTLDMDADSSLITISGEDHLFAPVFTFFDLSLSRTFTGNGARLVMSTDIDFDTWQTIYVVTFNGAETTDAKLFCDSDCQAKLSFVFEEQTYVVERYKAYVATLIAPEEIYILYDVEHYDEQYEHTFLSFVSGTFTVYKVQDGAIYVNGSKTEVGQYEYNYEYETVSFVTESYQVIAVDPERGLFFMIHDLELIFLITDEAMELNYGEYVSHGQTVLTVDKSGVDPVGATAGATLRMVQDGIGQLMPVFVFGDLAVGFDYMGAAAIYNVSAAGEMTLRETCITSSAYADLVGRYIYDGGAYERPEVFEFTQDGVLTVDTDDAGELKPVEYEYVFSHNGEGALVVSILVDVGGQTLMVPFTKTADGILSPGPNSYTYMREEYIPIQGTYYCVTDEVSGEGVVISVDGANVVINGETVSATVSQEDGCVNVVVEGYGRFAYVVTQEGVTVTYTPDGGDPIKMTKSEFDLAIVCGEYTVGDDVYTLEYSFETDTFTVLKNGEFFWNQYDLVVKDGHLCARFATPFGKVYFYAEEGEGHIIVEEGALPPLPPVPGGLY